MCSFFEVLLLLVNFIESVDALSNVKHVAFCQLEKIQINWFGLVMNFQVMASCIQRLVLCYNVRGFICTCNVRKLCLPLDVTPMSMG